MLLNIKVLLNVKKKSNKQIK